MSKLQLNIIYTNPTVCYIYPIIAPEENELSEDEDATLETISTGPFTIEDQKRECIAFCSRKNYDIVKFYVEENTNSWDKLVELLYNLKSGEHVLISNFYHLKITIIQFDQIIHIIRNKGCTLEFVNCGFNINDFNYITLCKVRLLSFRGKTFYLDMDYDFFTNKSIKRKNIEEITKNITNNCVIYLRVSTKKQVKSGSLDNQESICRDWCMEKGYNVLKVYKEPGISGISMDKRYELQKLLDELSPGIIVVFYDISRLTRNIFDCTEIYNEVVEKECIFCCVTEENVIEHIQNMVSNASLYY